MTCLPVDGSVNVGEARIALPQPGSEAVLSFMIIVSSANMLELEPVQMS